MNDKVSAPAFFNKNSSWIDGVRDAVSALMGTSEPAFRPYTPAYTPSRNDSRWHQRMRRLMTIEAE